MGRIMNCREALDTLEAVEVGALPATEAAARDAEQHRASCPACQAAWPLRQQWAHRLAEAVQNVPVPTGLGERLHQACTAPVVVKMTVASRRRIWGLVTAAAAVMLMLGIGWWWQPLPKLTEQDLLAAMTADLEPGTEFVGQFPIDLPDLWKRYYELNWQLIRGFPTSDHPAAGMVALVPFQFQTGDRHPPVRGRLLILRRDQFLGTLPAGDFSQAQEYYTRSGGAYAVWGEGNLIFVCLIPSGPADLHRFKEALTPSRSIT
jgi:hypothetical protein